MNLWSNFACTIAITCPLVRASAGLGVPADLPEGPWTAGLFASVLTEAAFAAAAWSPMVL